jgi:uncharacterized protein YecT (DUF1311 family)
MRLAATALATASATFAALPAAAGACGEAATQRDATACEQARLVAAQAPMTDAYRALSAALAPGPHDALERAQRAWLAWRAAACDFEASGVAGGSAAPMVRARCATRLTEERTAALRRLLEDCPEGDLACPARPR